MKRATVVTELPVAKHLAGTEGAGEIPLERALQALHTIAEFPCSEQDDLPAANMRQIALAALSGAGAGSEPGNPGREPVSGPGNAGGLAEAERPEVVAWLVVAKYPHKEARRAIFMYEANADDQGAEWCCDDGVVTISPLIDRAFVAQAERIAGALRAELQSQRERNTELIFKLGSATNGWGRCEKERDAALARAAELEGKLAELEKPVPTHGEHSELRRIAVALKNPLLSGEEASDLMVRYEALTMPDHIIALIDRQAQHSVPSGWKLVPLEPTPEMLDARRDCEDGMDGYLVEDTEYYFPGRDAVRAFLARVYRGLIAAAPAPGGER
ncbi:TPA: hypothetical protein ACHFZB_000805 [Pseudomonas aeruginosa]